VGYQNYLDVASARDVPQAFEESTSDPTAGARDPVVQRIKTASAPFIYDQAMYVGHTAGDLWEEQAPQSEPAPVLSAREQEILKWTLVGKSNHVIGELLNISLSTVNFHLRSAMGKLGVASKHQAAARAHALGII
jgi:DNA-binding CsgD family transcriptional regulator